MRLTQLFFFEYFNLLHNIVSFLIFPMVVLTYYHGWLVGILGYSLFIGVISGLSLLTNERIARLISLPLTTMVIFYSAQLVVGGVNTCLIWTSLAVLFLFFTYLQYRFYKQQIEQHREGQVINFTFPIEEPKGSRKEK